jgi:hypothetical protein
MAMDDVELSWMNKVYQDGRLMSCEWHGQRGSIFVDLVDRRRLEGDRDYYSRSKEGEI